MSRYVYTERTARKAHECKMRDGLINPGEKYYAVTIGGGGLGSLKFPDRLHLRCKEAHEKNEIGDGAVKMPSRTA